MLLTQTEMIYARGVKDLLCNPRYIVYAGGWNAHAKPPELSVVDIINTITGQRWSFSLEAGAYSAAAVSVSSRVYIVSRAKLFSVDLSGSRPVWKNESLPTELVDAIPAPNDFNNVSAAGASMIQNGVWVERKGGQSWACFYALPRDGSSQLVCYDSVHERWLPPIPTATKHKAGTIAAVGSVVVVAGGFNPQNHTSTAAIEIFDLDGGAAPAGTTCADALKAACAAAKTSGVFACAECAGANRARLRGQGCDNNAIAAWCARKL